MKKAVLFDNNKFRFKQAIDAFSYLWPLLVVLGFVIVFIFEWINSLFLQQDFYQGFLFFFKQVYWSFYNSSLESPWFYFGVPVVFALQYCLPVKKNEKMFGTAVRLDLFYTVAFIPFVAVVMPLFLNFLHLTYDKFFWFLKFSIVNELPAPTQILLGYILVDFLGWFHHLVRHKVPVFWELHAVHHSQQHLNPFSNFRVHFLEYFTANIIKFVPAFMFSEAFDIVLSYIVIHQLLDRLNHANVRTNLGWLRYIFVTPQSHRVHHSRLPQHFDMNYGISLSIWDHLFNTQVRNYHIYPKTGVPDCDFPVEEAEENTSLAVLRYFCSQNLYPFKAIWRQIKCLRNNL